MLNIQQRTNRARRAPARADPVDSRHTTDKGENPGVKDAFWPMQVQTGKRSRVFLRDR